MSMNKLMEFRTTFLRAIAEAWADDDFRTALLDDAEKALYDRFHYTWPWKAVCDLQIVTSQDSKGQSQFEWIDDAWVYSPDLTDALILSVPLAPRTKDHDGNIVPMADAKNQAMALGDYYKQYGSLFGDDWGHVPGTGEDLTIEVLAKALEALAKALEDKLGPLKVHPLAVPVIGYNSPYPTGGFIPADEEFAAFKVALLGAMAKAWQEASANQGTPFTSMLRIDAAAALHTIRGYKLPWTMRIKFVDDPGAYWVPAATTTDPAGMVTKIPSHWIAGNPSVLRLYFPDTPEVSSQPLALAAYNATGAEYPFTCCC